MRSLASLRGRSALGAVVALLINGPVNSWAAYSKDLVSKPGAVAPEPATQTALSVRWPVVGDANGNAWIKVSYRRRGETAWKSAHDLFRTHPAHVLPDNRVPGGWLFAGSVIGLVPGTRYEIKLQLIDPDGGSTERQLALTTAAEPILPASMRERYVEPLRPGESHGGKGTRADPIRGLEAAANMAEPGDMLLLQPGLYAARNVRPPNGAFGRKIAFRGIGTVIVDGGGADVLMDIRGRSHLWFENIVFRNASVLFNSDQASNIVLLNNRFQIRKYGIKAHGAKYTDSQHIIVSDNTFVGSLAWPPPTRSPEIYAISLTGAGHVIRFNRIRLVRDGIYNGDVGRLSASDIHNNDIAQCGDDGIEADYADTNVRVFNNRIVDCLFGVSMQPANGGPVYIYRNFIYNARSSPFKLHNHTSGILIYHNTSVKRGIPFLIQPASETVNDVVTRNNLFVGTNGPALYSTGKMTRCDFDNDGYAWTGGYFALWNGRSFNSTADTLHQDGPYGRHGSVDLGPRKPFDAQLWPPSEPNAQSDIERLDPRLAPNSRAVDRGVMLSDFNDRFSGRAPDLGCCERGDPLPNYGPR